MEGLAHTDDAARRIVHTWKGTDDGFTFFFDARYGAWLAAVGMALGFTPLLWPFARSIRDGGPLAFLVIAVLAAGASIGAIRQLDAFSVGHWRFLGLGGGAIVVMALLPAVGTPAGGLIALAAAPVGAAALAVLITRRVGKLISKRTPWKYWVAVLLAEAGTPRPKPDTHYYAGGVMDLQREAVESRVITPPTRIE